MLRSVMTTHYSAASLLLAVLTSGCVAPPLAPPAETPVEIPPQMPAEAPAATKDGATLFVEQALSMLGQPYRYGGAGPGGFDCSGLVVYTARQSGLLLPRTTEDLRFVGTAVGRDELRTGDLVFMHLAAKELHVGILLDDRRFIHAPSSGGVVRIDSLDRAPYGPGFLGARRLAFPP
jgi:cell wall-associated NlpC family hydrolase